MSARVQRNHRLNNQPVNDYIISYHRYVHNFVGPLEISTLTIYISLFNFYTGTYTALILVLIIEIANEPSR